MKYLKFFLLIFFLYQSAFIYSQKEDTLVMRRFFGSFIPAALLSSYGKRIVNGPENAKVIKNATELQALGFQIEAGNNWVFNKNKPITFYSKLTWYRLGLNNLGCFFAPANIGLGTDFRLNKNNSLEFSVNGGLITYTTYILDIFSGPYEFNYAVYYQLKLINISAFSIGVEYSYHRFPSQHKIRFLYGYNYFGLIIGGRFGDKIN